MQGYNLINNFNLFILGQSPGGGGERAVQKVPGPVYRRELSQKGHLNYFNLINIRQLIYISCVHRRIKILKDT